jgi:hypothetical protein
MKTKPQEDLEKARLLNEGTLELLRSTMCNATPTACLVIRQLIKSSLQLKNDIETLESAMNELTGRGE